MEILPSWLLTQTAAQAHRIVGDGFAAMGARGYHYRLLESLIDSGPASQAALGRRTGIHLSDMVAALNELEAQSYVERSPDPHDRRRNVITVTARGRERAAELADRVEAIQEELLAPLSAAERAQLASLLGRLLDHHRA
ncbi:MarR family winged helix-turn-helix transcriptional regulator [Micromonosporaceae bacterium Da 78-11]